MTDTGHIGGGIVNSREKQQSTAVHDSSRGGGGERAGGGMISQGRSSFVRENAPLPEEDGVSAPLDDHRHHRYLATRSHDGRGLVSGAPSPPALAVMGDKAWAVAFTAVFAATLLSAGYFLPSALTVLRWKSAAIAPWTLPVYSFGGATSVLVSFAVLFLSRHMTRLQIALGVYALIFLAVIRSLPDNLLSAVATLLRWVFPIACAAISYSYCVLRPSRVQFAAEILKVASMTVTSTPQIIPWAVCVTGFRCIWHAVGILACVGSMSALTSGCSEDGSTYLAVECDSSWVMRDISWECYMDLVPECKESRKAVFLLVFWIASVSWGSAVGANVVAATVADSVASRWSSAGNVDNAWRSCRRVIRSSLGSLCKGAALDGLSRPLRFVVSRLSPTSWVADALVLLARFTVRYVLLQPLCFVGVYRHSFGEGVRHARALLRTHGRTLLINDALVIAGLSFLCLAASAIPAIVTVVWVVQHIWSPVPEPSFVGTASVCSMITVFATAEVVLYASKAVFVCLVQGPDPLAEDHDQPPHDKLYKAWRELQCQHPPTRVSRGEIQV